MPRRLLRVPRSVLLAVAVLSACSTSAEQPTTPLLSAPSAARHDQVPAPTVVISQIYGGGGNASAPLRNDYIELFNPGTTVVDVSTWSVQYASSAGVTWQVTNLTGSILPGGYYLVQEAAGAKDTTALPTADATGAIAMAAGAGKVLVSNQTAAQSGSCPTGAAVIDHVGYGAADCGTGAALWTSSAPVLTNTTAALRNGAGCTFSGSPAADFASGPPSPRNTASATNVCQGVQQPVATVTVTPDPASVNVGVTQAFTATARDAASNVVSTTFTWTSSNTAAATVDANGVVTGVTEGTTTITATATNAVSGGAALTVTPAPAAGPGDVVISQIYGGGGNAGATFTNDFIELFNRSATPVNLAGWSVQYSSSAGNTWQVTPLVGTIQPGKYLLVQEAVGGGGTTALPTPEVVGTISMAGTAGKVLLSTAITAQSGSCPVVGSVLDHVGYGSSDCGTTWLGNAPAPSNTTADLRQVAGCTYTGNPASDFVAGPPTPRNGDASANTCQPPGDPATVTVAPTPTTVALNGTRTLTATAHDANGTDVATTFTWASSDPTIVSVDASGVVTGHVVNSSATVSATSANGKVGSSVVTVTPPPSHITVTSRPAQLPIGFQTQLFASGTDLSGVPITTVVWSSSDPSIVSVDQQGVISAAGSGSAQIIATAPDHSSGQTTIATETLFFSATARSGHNTEFGVPKDGTPNDDIIIARKQYTISYNPTHAGPNWVSWNLDATHLGTLDRCNCFTADTALTRLGFPAHTTADYVAGGLWDRGHMEPSADQTTTDTENAFTFFLSNTLPQKHDLNAGPWERLEIALRDSVRSGAREAYIVAGGIFTNGVGLGTLNDAGQIGIPDSTWKIVLIGPAGFGLADVHAATDVSVIAVNMPNVVGIASNPFEMYLTTIAKIEASTHYNFLDLLGDAIQCKIEVRNCLPQPNVVSATGSTTVAAGTQFVVKTSGADADGADGPWKLTIDWGDGTKSNSTLFALPTDAHPLSNGKTWSAPGTYTVSISIADKKGGTGVSTMQVTVTP
ncbi:MAG: DNA/RNA non-specific endonuclease [bacterium]